MDLIHHTTVRRPDKSSRLFFYRHGFVLFRWLYPKCAAMEKERKKIKEPYEPENTPRPPQNIEPELDQQRKNPVEEKGRTPGGPDKKKDGRSEKSHLLNENADIDDETTI